MQRTENRDDIIEIDLQELLGLLIHWLWLIIACGIVTGITAFLVSFLIITPKYESVTKVYILDTDSSNGSLTYSDMQLGSLLTKDYVQLIKDRTVLETVLGTFGMEESYGSLQSRVKVEAQADTRIIAIVVTDSNPRNAQILANEIRKVAAEHIKSVTEIQAVNVVEEANLPTSPSSPSIPKWTAIGGLLGMVVCALILSVRFLLDDTVKTTDDVEHYLGLSTLSMIPVIESENIKGKKKNGRRTKRAGDDNMKRKHARDIHYCDSDAIHNPKPNLDETGDLEEVL